MWLFDFNIGKLFVSFHIVKFQWKPEKWVWSKKEALKFDDELQGMFGDVDDCDIDYHIELIWLWFMLCIEI